MWLPQNEGVPFATFAEGTLLSSAHSPFSETSYLASFAMPLIGPLSAFNTQQNASFDPQLLQT
jgi:hypothetical protein